MWLLCRLWLSDTPPLYFYCNFLLYFSNYRTKILTCFYTFLSRKMVTSLGKYPCLWKWLKNKINRKIASDSFCCKICKQTMHFFGPNPCPGKLSAIRGNPSLSVATHTQRYDLASHSAKFALFVMLVTFLCGCRSLIIVIQRTDTVWHLHVKHS